MELKAGVDDLGRMLTKFQSHLYGIERHKVAEHCPCSACFNRTFMELKEVSCLDWNAPSGVSIAPLWNWKWKRPHRRRRRRQSFNRTFMELKVDTCLLLLLRWLFQSHLYGIESRICRQGSPWRWVSIAPLWNWKDSIEAPGTAQRGVSIAPLWNWKLRLYSFPVSSSCFNRTFMELKGYW